MATSVVMRNFKSELLKGNMDLDNSNYYVALLSGTNTVLTSVFENMINFSAAKVYETSGTGYVAGGIALTANPIVLDGTTAIWDCIDVTWLNSTINADGAVIYKSVTNENNSPLICFIDLYSSEPVGYKSSNNGSFTLQWNTNGILNLIS